MADFESEISEGLVLVDFWAPWCGPCQAMAPIIEELKKDLEGKAKVMKVNIDEDKETAQKYDIMSIPTVILFKDGEPVEQIVGLRPKDQYIAAVESHD